MGWIRRQAQRDQDLQSGVDADLIQDNRRRFRLALLLIGFAVFLTLVDRVLQPQGWLRNVVVWIAGGCAIAGFIGLRWAFAESSFLHNPDPKEPPSLFKR